MTRTSSSIGNYVCKFVDQATYTHPENRNFLSGYV